LNLVDFNLAVAIHCIIIHKPMLHLPNKNVESFVCKSTNMIAINEDIMSPKYSQSSTLWEELHVNARVTT